MLPTSVHKQWSHRYPPGCPEEIHTQELDIRVVHKWKSIDLASARDFLNNRFSETHAICKVYPEVTQTGPWLLNLSAHQGQLFSTFFSLGSPSILYQWRSGLMWYYLNLLTVSLLSSGIPPQHWSSHIHRNWQPLLKAKLTVSFFSEIPCGKS